MAFQVTPETDVAEAAMFHGACLGLEALNPIPSTANTAATVASIEYDTDGFFAGSVSGNAVFTIPEGVRAVKVGTALTAFSLGTGWDRVRVLVNHVTTNENIIREEFFTEATLVGPTCSSAMSRPFPVTGGDTIKLELRSQNADCRLQADIIWGPSEFFIEAVKTPFGRPDSPTLP